MQDLTNLLLKYYGIADWNSGHNTIQRMIEQYNFKAEKKVPLNAEWCAILLFNLCKYLNYDVGKANAWVATWCNVGTEIDLKDAQMGDLVIIGNNVYQTHLTTFLRFSDDEKFAYCFGGNQNQQLNISYFKLDSIFKIIRLTKLK
jgi:hypothetical protein